MTEAVQTKSIFPKDMHQAKVERLIDADAHKRKEELILNMFEPEEAHAILALPIGANDFEDRRIWRFMKKSFFTVRKVGLSYNGEKIFYSSCISNIRKLDSERMEENMGNSGYTKSKSFYLESMFGRDAHKGKLNA